MMRYLKPEIQFFQTIIFGIFAKFGGLHAKKNRSWFCWLLDVYTKDLLEGVMRLFIHQCFCLNEGLISLVILVEFELGFKFLYEKKVVDEGLYFRPKIWKGRQPSTGL